MFKEIFLVLTFVSFYCASGMEGHVASITPPPTEPGLKNLAKARICAYLHTKKIQTQELDRLPEDLKVLFAHDLHLTNRYATFIEALQSKDNDAVNAFLKREDLAKFTPDIATELLYLTAVHGSPEAAKIVTAPYMGALSTYINRPKPLNCLLAAYQHKNTPMFEFFLPSADETTLLFAVAIHSSNLYFKLLEHGLNPLKECVNDNSTPLSKALEVGSVTATHNCIEFATQKPHYFPTKNAYEKTLAVAQKQGNQEVVDWIEKNRKIAIARTQATTNSVAAL